VTFGLLNEALGRASPALTGVLTVQTMVSIALVRWGTAAQRKEWLPRLAGGSLIAGFALTEPGGGSDLEHQRTAFTRRDGRLVLNGTKRWISCGQFAGVFLVFARLDGLATAALVPAESPGLRIEPITDLMGFRAAGLAQLDFHEVEVPIGNLVGKPGFGLSHVAQVGLHYGRISTACSALGLLRGCFEESVAWAGSRRIGEEMLGDLGMARSLIARMGTDLGAATALCRLRAHADGEVLHLASCRARSLRRGPAARRRRVSRFERGVTLLP
jgi:alkylation response protein AidB-like acyl-CoA dehydrogenase